MRNRQVLHGGPRAKGSSITRQPGSPTSGRLSPTGHPWPLSARCWVLTTLLVPSIFTAGSIQANAQENPPSVTTAAASAGPSGGAAQLPEVVVTATRTEETSASLPYSISVVGRQELLWDLPRTTPEALRELPSVMLQKTAHGQGSPYLRGFTGFRTLMLVDGIRLNNSTFRDGPNQYWNTVDAMALERLEVVRGPSSALYGSDAIGGTVNAISTERTQFENGVDWDRRLFYRYSSAEQSHIGRAEVSGNVDQTLGFHLGGTWKEFGDLRGGADVGKQPRTGYTEKDLDAKLQFYIAPDSWLVFGHQTVDIDDAWRTHSTIYGVLWSGTTRGSDLSRVFDQNRDLDYIQYHATNLNGFAQELHVSVSRHYQAEVESRTRSNQAREYQGVDVNTLGVSVQLQSQSPVGRWVYGTEYYRDWVDSFYRGYNAAGSLTSRRIQGPVGDEASYDLAGVYAQDTIPLFDDRLEVILGGRFTYAAADADRVQDPFTGQNLALSDSWNNVVGNGRLLYRLDPEEHWTLFAGISQGFRAPNLSDLTRFDIARSGEQEIPAFGLRPEHFLSPEVGVKVGYERVAAEAAYFRTFMDDLVVRVPTGDTTPNGDLIVNKENSGEGYIHGVELTGSLKLHPEWTLWSNFTWMEGRLDTPVVAGGSTATEPVSRLMPTTVNYGLEWRHPSQRYWAEFSGTLAARQERLASNDIRDTQRIPVGGTPGYSTFSLRAGWRPITHLTLLIAVENLTDEDYRIHGSGVNEPGRNFIVSADIRF